MECHGKMDSARRASTRPLIRLLVVLLFCPPHFAANAQENRPVPNPTLRQLFDAQQWQQIVAHAEADGHRSADVDFYYGSALAHLGRWQEAGKVFWQGQQLQPRDPRFPVELAGIAFKEKRYAEAAKYLRRALRLNPGDPYSNDFLGTVYFLEGNLNASLKYWNRIGKPYIVQIQDEPAPALDPSLLDHAFAFSRASVLRLPELRATEARLHSLGIFPNFHFELAAQPDGNFISVFYNQEKNGAGANKWIGLLMLLRGLPAETVYPEFFNIKHQALNFTSSYRWDAQKRRVQAEFAGPVGKDPKRHFGLGVDLRNENWAVVSSFTGPATALGGFNLRREAVDGRFAALPNDRLHWSADVELSHRDFRSQVAGPALTPALLAEGFQLKENVEANYLLWDNQDRRMHLDGRLDSQTGRLWSQPGEAFEKLQTSSYFRWLPRSMGDDYELEDRVSAGKTFGNVPFDELWMLGIGGDNDLWMRGHIATRDRRKGSAPLGRDYFLSNLEMDKNICEWRTIRLIGSPFWDTGAIRDAVPGLGSHEWLYDVGAALKVKAFGFGVSLSYGKDLRSGNNAIYVTMLR
jgi:tetratricopeptide (TPR) repeat protein